jgi:hypothetical protein
MNSQLCLLMRLRTWKSAGTSNNPTIQSLNSGYKKDGKVHRVIKNLPTQFSTYCPKVIAGINPLSPALADRCITIEMQKAPSSNKVAYLTSDVQNKLEVIKAGYRKNFR